MVPPARWKALRVAPERLRVLIVDDEPPARTRLRILCEARSDVAVIGQAATGEEALELARSLSPDLMLMDIAMPGLDGLGVARMMEVGASRPAVVFCTAYDRHAVAAFDLDAVDYLLKPISGERLGKAIERVRRPERLRPAAPPATGGVPDQPAFIQAIWAPYRGEMRKVPVCKIDRIEAEDDYVRLFTPERSYLLHEAMARLEQKLDPASFIRLRRSVIVRRDMLEGLRCDGLNGWSALLADGGEVRIGPTYLARVKALLKS